MHVGGLRPPPDGPRSRPGGRSPGTPTFDGARPVHPADRHPVIPGLPSHPEFEKLWSRLRTQLLDAQRLGELAAETDIEEATYRLVALIDGLSVEAVLYPARVPPDRQVALLDQLLRGFAKPPLRPARTLTE